MNGRRERLPARTLRYVVLCAGAVLMVGPFLYLLSTSFKPQALVLEIPPRFLPTHPTTAAYAQAWNSANFSTYFLNSTIVAVASTVISLVLSAMMAFALARFEFVGKRIVFGALLLALMIPGMMLLLPQFLLARRLGLIDSLSGLVVFYVAGSLALNTFLLRGFMEDQPHDLHEAMLVDGANALVRFTRLALPLARPALAAAAIFTFIGSWEEFVLALTLNSSPANWTLPVGIAQFQGQHQTSWNLVFAASTIALIPVIVVFLAFQRQFVRGLTAGAVKG
jgi:ABC-type glycerol-3-phosphate transport system permease component